MTTQTLTAQLAQAQQRIAELERQLAAKTCVPHRKVVACKPWTRPAHMEAARQLAMSTHVAVLV